jgi:Holliday junction resolvase
VRLKNAKAKGSRLERQSRDILRNAGMIVIKAGGSLGPADLIGLIPEQGRVVFVQVKSNRGVSPAERQALINLAARCRPTEWNVLIHRWRDRKGVSIEII